MKVALLFFAALASTALAAPSILAGSCATHCSAQLAFAYEPGKSYVYDYSVLTTSALLGVDGDDAVMKITAVAHMDVSAPCEHILRLTDVNLEGDADLAGKLSEALTMNPLKFSFQDGMIENICSVVSEPTWVLNFKRGLLSTFQNTMTAHGGEFLQEKDVSGVCETEYKSVTEGDVVNVERITHMNTCSERPDFSTFISSSSYITDSPVQNLPVMKTTNICHQKIEKDIMISAECEEIYKARPFGEGQEVAKTTVKTSLVLKSQEALGGVSDFEFYRKSLVYEDIFEPVVEDPQHVHKLLSDLAMESASDVHSNTPTLFADLVDHLKNMDYPKLTEILASATAPLTHKFMVDALPLVGTAPSMAVVRDLIIKGEMSEIERDIWFTSLAFQKHPTAEMLKSIAPLIETNPSQKALLGTSALINNYCKWHKTCDAEPEVQQIVTFIEKQLGAGCRFTNEDEKEHVLVALKALGNAGHWVNAKSILETCYLEENDMEVRIAALDAWRHTPCEYDRSNLLTVFKDESYDPELRIGAYLALMSCPTPSFIDIVKERLISEGVNQVGSFVWTHMTNLQESAAPEKQWMHEMIGEELLQKKFNSDALRFSRNYESSFFMNELNIGASVESNVVFNSKSYLPRSAMLNLTLDIFGESINFFEIGGRIDGFEAYIERFFGSNGYFPEEHVEQALRNMRANSNADSTTLEGFLDKISDEPEGSYYLRVFGNELHYHHFHGLENFFMKSSHVSHPMDLLMDILRQGKVEYTKSIQLMDTHINIPTISGLPLMLDSKVTGNFGLEMTNNFHAESFTNFNVEGHLHPSVAVEYDGNMILDAHVTKTGVKISSTLHTSTFLDGKVQIVDGKVVDIAINSPKEKVEILDVKGEFIYVINNEQMKKEVGQKREMEHCTPDILGMELCGSVSLMPSPIGPFAADIYLKKTGTQTGYIMHFKRDSDTFEVLFDTPGSQTDHKVSLNLAMAENSISVDIHTPVKSGKGNLDYIWTNLNKKLKCAVSFDDGSNYGIETSLLKNVEDFTIFEPSVIVITPVGEILNIKGILKTKLDYYHTMISTKLDTVYAWNGQNTLHFEVEAVKQLTDTMSTYTLHGAIDPSQFADFRASVDMTFTEVEHQQYKAQVKAVIKEEAYILEGKLEDNSVKGKFNVVADGSLMAPAIDAKGTLGLYADSEKATSEIHTTVNGQNYDVKFEGTKISALFEANVIRHILINAQISQTPDVQKLHITGEWNKDVDPTAMFLIEGQLSQNEIMAHVKFVDQEATVKSTLVDSGVELEATWNGKTVTTLVKYTMGETKSVSVLVQTPFSGFEKQEASFSVTLKDLEITSQLTASWQNSKQLALSVAGKIQTGAPKKSLHTEIAFSSSFPNFEHISFKVDHEINENSLKSDFLASWDSWKLISAFQFVFSGDGVQSSFSLEAPFTDKILLNLNHVLNNNDLTSTLEVKFGDKVATANLKGVVVLGSEQDVTLALKMNIPSLPEITATVNYHFNWSKLSLVFEGIMGDKKSMLNVNGELEMADTTKLIGDLRFITPFTQPITGILEHTSNPEEFQTKFELTRFWSNYGNLKLHAHGHMKSAEDIVLSVDLFTPLNKASISVNHKVTDTNMISTLDAHFNAEKITIYVNGLLDVSKSLANLEAAITSTLWGLDDLKVTIDSLKNGNERVTKFVFTKYETSVTIDHTISATDIFNWENTLTVNGLYKLKNVNSYSGTLSKHDMEFMWDDKSLHLATTFDNQSSGNSHKFDATVALETPWIDVIKAEFHHEDNGIEYKPTFVIEYAPGRKIELENFIVFDSVFSCGSILKTPFMENLGYKFKLDFSSPRKVLHLNLKYGERHITFDAAGEIQMEKMNSNFEIQSTFLSSPVTVEASYDFTTPEKKIHLLATFIKKFEITGLLSGSFNEGNWSLIAEIPLDAVQHIELTGKWAYSGDKASIEVHSSVTSFENMAFEIMFDVNEKKVEVKMAYGSKVIHLTGKYEAETILLEMDTPFSGWEKMKASLFVSETSVDVSASKNDQTISVKGSLHVKPEKGTINLTINTPFAGYEEISANLSYSLRGPVKQIKLDSSFAIGQITLVGVIDLSKDLSPMMKLEATTPFDVVKTIGGEATWDLQHIKKTADIKAYRNDRQYHWQLEVSSEILSKVHVKSEITTPFEGWTHFLLEGNFDLTKMPYNFKFSVDKEGAVHTVEGNFNLEDKAIAVQLMTPIPGWEDINFSGEFNWEENHFTGNFEATVSGDKFHLTTDIHLNTSKPKLHIALETPIAQISKVDLAFDSDLIDTNKKLHLTFTLNDTIYSLDFEGEIIYKNGYVKIMAKSPIPGFSSASIYTKYDFSQDIKTAEVDLKIEGDSKHFYLKTSVQNNNFHIEIHTPFQGFELIKMIGDYSAQNDKHTVLASFEKDHTTYDYNADVTVTDYSISIGISTPIEVMKNVAVSIKYELFKNGVEGLLHFDRNGENYEIKTRAIFTPMKSELLVGVKTPFADWEKLNLDIKYDVISEKKGASLFIQKGSFEKKVTADIEYSSMKSGAIELHLPIEGYEVLGASYTLDLDENNNKLDASLKMNLNAKTWNFSVHGEYAPNKITIKFETPFDVVKAIIVDGRIDFGQKIGYLNVELGTYKFNLHVSYAVHDMVFKLTTPFDLLKIISLGFTYKWTESQKDATLNVIYNENNYVLSGILNLSPRTSEVTLQASSPFPGFSNVSMMIKYDIDNLNEIIMSKMTSEQYEYSFKLGTGIEGTQAHLNWDFTSTFPGWNHVQFLSNLNWAPDQKTLEISLGKDENMKAISISGHILGFSEGSLNIHTPFRGMEEMGGYFKFTAGEKLEGKLDLVLPFYMIPKIEGTVDLDLNGKIAGDAKLNLAGEIYTMRCNLVGASFEEGYTGDLMIYTPIHALSKVILNGNIIISGGSSLQTHMKADIPSGVYEVDLKGKFALGDSSFLFELDSTLMNVHRMLTLEAKYPSLDNIEGTLVTVLDSMTHKIHGKFNIAANHLEGAFDIESPLIDGKREISFDITFPSSSYQHLAFTTKLVTSESHTLKLELNLIDGVEFILGADSPLVSKFTATITFKADTAGISLETSGGVHKIQGSWRMTYQFPADYLLALEVVSPLLPSDVIINALLNGDKANMIFKGEVTTGGQRHVVEGSYSLADKAIEFSLNVELPYLKIAKATLVSAMNFSSTVKIHLTGTFNDKVNTFDLVYEKGSSNFQVEITSPFIPTGMVRGEGQIHGEMMKDMEIKLQLQNNEQSVSGIMDVQVLSKDDIRTKVIITTPFAGYKKMKFGAQYLKDEEIKMLIFVDKPVKFSTELHLKNDEDEVKMHLEVETPIENFKKIEGELKIPLKVFGPKILADVMVGDVHYGGNLEIRTRAPYELDAGFKFRDEYAGRFHIRTDSSFFSVLA